MTRLFPHYRAIALLVLGLALPAIARADIAPVKPVIPHIAVTQQGRNLLISIQDIPGNPIKLATGADGLLLTYPGPIAALDTRALLAASAGRLASVDEGYDTILLTGETMVVGDKSELGGRINVLFVPAAAPAEAAQPAAEADTASSPPSAADAARLPLTRALISTSNGNYTDASNQYELLLSSTPATAEILEGYAQNEEEHGNWRHAYWLYEQSLERNPGDQDAMAGMERISTDHERFAGTDAEYRDLKGYGIILATTTTAAQPVSDGVQALVQYDAQHISTHAARRLDGQDLPAHQWSTAQSAGAAYNSEDGVEAEGWLYSSYKFGTGGSVSLPTSSGHVIFGGEYDRANWDYLEGLVNNGTRDRLYAEEQVVFDYNWSGQLTLGYNYYNLGEQRNLANGPAASGELRYKLIHDDPSLDLVYALDAEYSVRSVNRFYNGVEYKPFPLINREVHTVVLESDAEVGRLLDFLGGTPDISEAQASKDALATSDYGLFDIYVGAGDDRYGQPGPLVGGSWTKRIDPIEFQLRASYESGLDRESQSGTVVGGYLKARF